MKSTDILIIIKESVTIKLFYRANRQYFELNYFSIQRKIVYCNYASVCITEMDGSEGLILTN